MTSFPDLAIRLYNELGDCSVTISSFEPDADDEGRAHDYGSTILEDGAIVGDGTKNGFNMAKIQKLLSLLENAPDMYSVLVAFTEGKNPMLRAQQLINKIDAGELKYGS